MEFPDLLLHRFMFVITILVCYMEALSGTRAAMILGLIKYTFPIADCNKLLVAHKKVNI